MLATEFGAAQVLLTDSGTSALVLALRMVAKAGLPVAMPAYACVDLIAAARRADVRVRFFDIDPHTLSPDMDSLTRVVTADVCAIVVAHLYGFPADMPAVMAIAARAGVPVIEDAAQHACATIDRRPAGSFGDLAVLSFGRGKGTTSGRGGALLARNETPFTITDHDLGNRALGLGDLAVAKASWLLGRPSIYGLPASIPALHLGETVYHEAGEPRAMSRAAAALLTRTLRGMKAAAVARRAVARRLSAAVAESSVLTGVHPIASGEAGYLRFPVLMDHVVEGAPDLGIARGYPRPLAKEPEAQPCLADGSESTPGATQLAAGLVTLPTHHLLSERDIQKVSQWVRDRV